MAQTGRLTPATLARASRGESAPGSAERTCPGVAAIGRLNAAENGLVTASVASRSSDIEEKPSRYHPNPTGPTNRIRRVRYVSTSATEVRRATDEQSRPIVDVARQVVAMISK